MLRKTQESLQLLAVKANHHRGVYQNRGGGAALVGLHQLDQGFLILGDILFLELDLV